MNGKNNLLSTLRNINTEIKQKKIKNELKCSSSSSYSNVIKEIEKKKEKYIGNLNEPLEKRVTLPFLFFRINFSEFFLFSLIFASLFSFFSIIRDSGILTFNSPNVKLSVPDDTERKNIEEDLFAKLKNQDEIKNFRLPEGFSIEKLTLNSILRDKSSSLFYISAMSEYRTPFYLIARKDNSDKLKIIDINFE